MLLYIYIRTLINNVNNYKYLGIIIDSKLDFKNHIIKLNNKLSQIQFLISKLSKFIDNYI